MLYEHFCPGCKIDHCIEINIIAHYEGEGNSLVLNGFLFLTVLQFFISVTFPETDEAEDRNGMYVQHCISHFLNCIS